MLKLQPNPTFRAKVGIPLPGGETSTVELEFRHMDRDALKSFLAEKARPDEDTLMAILTGWSEIDAPFNAESVKTLCKQYLAFARVVSQAWVDELSAHRLGN